MIQTRDRLAEFRATISPSLAGKFVPSDIMDILIHTVPTTPVTNFSKYTATIPKIMELVGQDPVDRERFMDFDNFDLLNPTDFSKPNFITYSKHYNDPEIWSKISTVQKMQYNTLINKAINPLRLSLEEAVLVEELTREDRVAEMRRMNGTLSDDQIILERALFMSYLSPEAFAASFFYHNLYETGQTFSIDSGVAVNPFQKAMMNCNNNHIALLVSRQRGKSTVLHVIMMWYVIFRLGFRGFFVGPSAQTVQDFIQGIFNKQGGGKIHPYLTGAGDIPSQECYGFLHLDGRDNTLRYQQMNPETGELSRSFSQVKTTYAKGNKKFVGSTNQGLFFDEIATYPVDPTKLILPSLKSYGHLAFTYYATTQREGGNPFISVMNRPDVRLFQRNIWSGYYAGYVSQEELDKVKNEYLDAPQAFQTEFECVIPNEAESLLTVQDISSAAHEIDAQISMSMDPGELSTKAPYWEMRDENIKKAYDIHEFFIGVDWNQETKGNFVAVAAAATCKNKPQADSSGRAMPQYNYIMYDGYNMTGNTFMYNTAVLMGTLIDKYAPKEKIQVDSGCALAFKQTFASNPELWKTPNGTLLYTPAMFEDSEATFHWFEFVSFQRKIRTEQKDNFGVTYETSSLLREALINTMIHFIKQKKLLFSPYESFRNKLVADDIEMEANDVDTEVEAERIRAGSRVLDMRNRMEKLNPLKMDPNTYAGYFLYSKFQSITFIDELMGHRFDGERGKFVSVKKSGPQKVEDDRIVAACLALYPAIQKYENFYLEDLNKDEERITVKIDKKKESSENYAANISIALSGGGFSASYTDNCGTTFISRRE